MNLRVVIVLAGAAAALWSVRRWREAVQLAMVLVIFEGAIRKWVFPGAQDLIYFAKDVLLLGAYLGYFRDPSRLRFRMPSVPVISAVILMSALVGALQIFNPELPNLLVGVFGFKAYFFYIPLLFVLPAAFANDGELYTFLRRYALIAIPVGLLATAQFFSPASSCAEHLRPHDSGERLHRHLRLVHLRAGDGDLPLHQRLYGLPPGHGDPHPLPAGGERLAFQGELHAVPGAGHDRAGHAHDRLAGAGAYPRCSSCRSTGGWG